MCLYSIGVDPSVGCRHSHETMDVTCVFTALVSILVLAVAIILKLWMLLVYLQHWC